MRWWCTSALLPPLLLLGCAKAGPINGATPDAPIGIGGNPDANNIPHIDADTHIDAAIDAKPIDAPPGMQTVTLSQTTNTTIAAHNSIACSVEGEDVTPCFESSDCGTRPNTYYRMFDLGSAGITTTFEVSSVTFGVEDCDTVNGTGTDVGVIIGTYSGADVPDSPGGTLVAGDITVVESNNAVAVPELDEDLGDSPIKVPAPITASIPGGSKLIVEINVPDGSGSFDFYPGASTGGQSALGFISSSTCSVNTPTDINAEGSASSKIDLVIEVTGTYTL